MNLIFPAVTESQVVLVRVDALTGHVLDDKFKLHISESQNGYSIFNTYEEAMSYVENVIKKMPNMEVVVFNNREDVLYYFNPFNDK